MADHSFCRSAPPEVHRFHFVLGSSSPSVPFCSLSKVLLLPGHPWLSALESLSPCSTLDCNSWIVWFASLHFSWGYPQTEVAHYLSSDRSSTLPTKGRQSRLTPNPCLTSMGLRTCLSVSGLHVSKRNGSILLVLLPSGSTVKTGIKTPGLHVKGHICEALPARNVIALTPPLTENSGNWAGNHFSVLV